MADRHPTRTSPDSRRNGYHSLQPLTSPPMSGMRPSGYPPASGGLSLPSNVSPTLERRPRDRGFPALSASTSDPAYVGAESRSQPSIRFRRLPRNFDISILRNILAFSDPKDCYLLATEDGHSDAVATFSSASEARDAQQRLNGKALPENGARMIVDVVSDDEAFGSRRNTIDGTSARLHSTSASSSASSSSTANNSNTNSITLPRHNSRYSFGYPSIQEAAPAVRSPGATNSNLHSIFSPTSPVANGNSGNSLRQNADLEDDDVLLSQANSFSMNGGYSPSHHSPDQGISASFNALTIQTNMSNGHGVASPDHGTAPGRSFSALQSPSIMSVSGSINGWTFNRPRQTMPPANPADQNPPCNTLYVGNLPPNTCEDELKALFSRQRGYKRLCFRTKHNGPMCFVEFDDINYAAQSLDNLYGTMLTNSIKGGIRLSFSKNPLGVRQGGLSSPNSPMSPHGLGPGSGSGGGASFTTANGPPPGLPSPFVRATHGTFGSNGSNHNTSARSFGGGGGGGGAVSPSASYAPPMHAQANHGGWNGGLAGMNSRQQLLRQYQPSGNGSFNSMMNGT